MIVNKYDSVYVMGDFNYKLSSSTNSNNVNIIIGKLSLLRLQRISTMNTIPTFDNGRSTSTIDHLFSNCASLCSHTKVILTNHRYTDHNAISSTISFPTGIVIQKGPKFKWKRFHGDEMIQKHFQAKLYSL